MRNYTIAVSIGAHDFEKVKLQNVIFNVELFVPYVLSTPQTDRLSEVLDYDFIRERIATRIQIGHIELQETLCDDLASGFLAHPLVQAVRLSSYKPDVYPDCEGIGIEVFRQKKISK